MSFTILTYFNAFSVELRQKYTQKIPYHKKYALLWNLFENMLCFSTVLQGRVFLIYESLTASQNITVT